MLPAVMDRVRLFVTSAHTIANVATVNLAESLLNVRIHRIARLPPILTRS